jgi:hypothetical protein
MRRWASILLLSAAACGDVAPSALAVDGGSRGDATVAHDSSVARPLDATRSLDASDGSCDPGVPGVKCLARVPTGNGIFSLVVDDESVYFISSYLNGDGGQASLVAASRTTGELVTLATSFPPAVLGLVKDDAAVYGAHGPVVSRVPLDGGPARTIPLPDRGRTDCLAFDGDFLLVNDGAFLYRVPKSGGPGFILAPADEDDGIPGAVTALDGRAYFSAWNIYSVAVDGGPVQEVFPALGASTFTSWCHTLLTTGGSLISARLLSGSWSVVVLPLDGGARRPLDSISGSTGIPFVVSRTAVYSLGFNPTEDAAPFHYHVVRMPLDGGPAQSLAIVPTDGPPGVEFQDLALASDGTLYLNTYDRILSMKVE